MAVLDFVRSHPYWPLRFLMVYLGNPVVFVPYFCVMSNNTTRDGVEVFGIKTFRTVATNTSRLNIVLFVLITLPLYLLWFVSQIGLLVLFSSRPVRVDRFATYLAAVWSCCAAIPGLLNLLVWSSPAGMEGNVMGFGFALPLLVAFVAYVVAWLVAVCAALGYL